MCGGGVENKGEAHLLGASDCIAPLPVDLGCIATTKNEPARDGHLGFKRRALANTKCHLTVRPHLPETHLSDESM